MADDAVLATAAASQLGLTRSNTWPMVAAYLLAYGHDSPAVLELACLDRTSSPWQIDDLVPGALHDIDAPDLDVNSAAEIVVRLLTQITPPTDDYFALRTLARLAPELDYPDGLILKAYTLDEWLDCDCHRHSPERAAAQTFERELRSLPPLDLPQQLAAALINGKNGQG
jgi:hypothetical protein